MSKSKGEIRKFDTGATRDTDDGKLCYSGFLNPFVIKRYAEYMHKHRMQSDGTLRDPDNWQKGMSQAVYMDSKYRHFMDTWMWFYGDTSIDIEEVLCAEMFNTMGFLLEVMRKKNPDSEFLKYHERCAQNLKNKV
jgi:hypothetical protein